jgi:hypothetical protein
MSCSRINNTVDTNKDANMNTKKDNKQAATSVVAGTSTPGAIHVNASSTRGQQAIQKGNITEGPSYYPEDHLSLQQVPSNLEQEYVSSKRAAGQSHPQRESW